MPAITNFWVAMLLAVFLSGCLLWCSQAQPVQGVYS